MEQTYSSAQQKAIGSGFNASSATGDVIKGIDLTGKTIIVTGGYAGIGLETTKTLVSAGATVIVPARDKAKAAKNLAGLDRVEVESMDLMNPTTIDAFAEKFIASNRPLHLLINNAGIMWVPLQRDARGYESQLATNHLGHFHLTARLWQALKRAKGARVINVSSFGHQMAPFHFEDPHFLRREYETLQGYGQSKTANNMFTVELDRRGKEVDIRSFAVHPGSVNGTDLGRVAPMELFQQMGTHDANGLIFEEVAAKLKTIPQGAATTVWCATSASLNHLGGLYCENCDIADLDEGNIAHLYNEPWTLRGVKEYSIDKEKAKQLWSLSEGMLGFSFEAN